MLNSPRPTNSKENVRSEEKVVRWLFGFGDVSIGGLFRGLSIFTFRRCIKFLQDEPFILNSAGSCCLSYECKTSNHVKTKEMVVIGIVVEIRECSLSGFVRVVEIKHLVGHAAGKKHLLVVDLPVRQVLTLDVKCVVERENRADAHCIGCNIKEAVEKVSIATNCQI